MPILITGVTGFAGGHLAEYLYSQSSQSSQPGQPDEAIWGCGRSAVPPDHLSGLIHYRQADLRQPEAVRALVEEIRPTQVYHLAAQSFVPASWEDPWGTLEVNIRAQLNLFDAVHKVGLNTRLVVVTSSEVYGQLDDPSLAINEQHPMRPQNPYAASKAAQDMLARQYAHHWELPIICARPGNHIGLRQNSRFVGPAFARQVAAIELGLQPPVLKVGDLSAERDFTDVRDVVRAYALLMAAGEPGEAYNIGAGKLRPVRSILDLLLAETSHNIEVTIDPARLRKVATPGMRPDVGKIQAATGWQAKISFEATIRDLLNYERAQLRREQNQSTEE